MTSDKCPLSTFEITAYGKRRYFSHAVRKRPFPATCLVIFRFKHLLSCSDDKTLPKVEKICHSMGFQGTNCLRVNKVRTTGCIFVQRLLRIMKGVTEVTQ